MSSSDLLVVVVALALLAAVQSSSSSGGAPNHNYDLSGSDLRTLLSSPVFMAERMRRPLDGQSIMVGVISHSGVRVTLANGSQWLVHKGPNAGISSDTVVVAARHMSSKWKFNPAQNHNFQGRKTVSDFVADGGSDYNLIFANCHIASGGMMRQ